MSKEQQSSTKATMKSKEGTHIWKRKYNTVSNFQQLHKAGAANLQIPSKSSNTNPRLLRSKSARNFDRRTTSDIVPKFRILSLSFLSKKQKRMKLFTTNSKSNHPLAQSLCVTKEPISAQTFVDEVSKETKDTDEFWPNLSYEQDSSIPTVGSSEKDCVEKIPKEVSDDLESPVRMSDENTPSIKVFDESNLHVIDESFTEDDTLDTSSSSSTGSTCDEIIEMLMSKCEQCGGIEASNCTNCHRESNIIDFDSEDEFDFTQPLESQAIEPDTLLEMASGRKLSVASISSQGIVIRSRSSTGRSRTSTSDSKRMMFTVPIHKHTPKITLEDCDTKSQNVLADENTYHTLEKKTVSMKSYEKIIHTCAQARTKYSARDSPCSLYRGAPKIVNKNDILYSVCEWLAQIENLCMVGGPALKGGREGERGVFYMEVNKEIDMNQLEIEINGPQDTHPWITITPMDETLYEASYVPELSGRHYIAITYEQLHLLGSPFIFDVLPCII